MSELFRKKTSELILASLVASLCVLAVGALQFTQMNRLTNRATATSLEALQQEEAVEKLRLNLLQKTPGFGYDNLFADWVYLIFLQYFGDDEVRKLTGYSLSPKYFEIIVDHDPRFLGVYISLSTSISLYAAKPEQSVALMEKGLQVMSPQSPLKGYYVWRQKGIDELLFLGNAKAARQSFKNAAEWASTYSDKESQKVASISRRTSEFLVRNPQSKLVQVSAWAMVLNNVPDKGTRQIVINHIEALGGKVIVTPEGAVKIRLPPKDSDS
jgi:hypothetical protein